MHRHTTVTYQNKMYLYGGKVNIFQNSNKLFSYDFQTDQWEIECPSEEAEDQKISDFSFPLHIDSHNAEVYEKEMIVFGGFIGGKVNRYSCSIIAYDFEEKSWKAYYLQKKEKESSKQTKDITKVCPKKRANSGMAIYNGCVYIFGGTNGKRKLKDMWKFNLLERKWSEIELKPSFPDVFINFIVKFILKRQEAATL